MDAPASRGLPHHRVIAIAGLESSDALLFAGLEAILCDTFHCHAVPGHPLAMPEGARDDARRQYLSSKILDALADAILPEWDRLLGIAEVDLFIPELTFVLGQADPRRRVSLISTCRLRVETRRDAFIELVATEAVHEIGHTFWLAHCGEERCAMRFSNTVDEVRRKGPRLCARHQDEIAERVLAAERSACGEP